MIAAYIISYLVSYLCARAGHYLLSGILLVIVAAALYAADVSRSGNPVSLRGLFSLSFVGGEGISCLKLSYLQKDWAVETWLAFFFAFLGFYLLFELSGRYMNQRRLIVKCTGGLRETRLFACTVGICVISLLCFLLEAFLLGYVPLFLRGVPHAYSYFHISGVHYFTVSCVLVPSFSVLWFFKARQKTRGKIVGMLLTDFIALTIPVLCVSRMQFLSAVALAVLTYIVLVKRLPWKLLLASMIGGVLVFTVLSVARSHDAEYLNSIFEMKVQLPVFLSRIYIYIANNYDNFDCLVKELPQYSYGLRILFPLWALTGLKFIFPQLVAFPLYVTKAELTTVTLFYDFYYDFGLVGVLAGSMLIGLAGRLIERWTIEREDPLMALIYAQFALYMVLAFFTTWFSNPTTWFYLAVTAGVYLLCRGEQSNEKMADRT